MSTLFKNLFDRPFYNLFLDIIHPEVIQFDRELFLKMIFTQEFEQLELKERMTYTAKVLHKFMPADFDEASEVLISMIKLIQASGSKSLLGFMFLPEYISMYGLNNLKSAIKAMEAITQFTSCEFAVRPFILKYESEMLVQLKKWSKHKNNRVRRLASEGSRPRLPWSVALPSFKKNPHLILPILENLKQDSCEIVRRSVANSLNDISKDNPKVVIEIAEKWRGISKETDSIIKHGLRTLLKSSHPVVLNFYNLTSEQLIINSFEVNTPIVKIGDYLEFQLSVTNQSPKNQLFRIEYCLFFRKKNGENSMKVYKISERDCKANSTITMTKKHSFRIITTKVFYPGEHQLKVKINGKESDLKRFLLME